MDTIVIASTEADAAAVTAVEQHHAQLLGTLSVRVDAVLGAVARGDGAAVRAAAAELATWCEWELVPHAAAEEAVLYPVARDKPEGRLLVDALVAEHGVLLGLVRELTTVQDVARTVAAASALRVVFDSHQAKENTLVLPLLAADPDVDLAGLLAGMHDALDASAPAERAAAASAPVTSDGQQSCGCGGHDDPDYPELDARAVPHAIRHATVFGALDAVRPGGGLILVAPHDPLPLLAQLERRAPGVFEVGYLQRGPEVWRLTLVRRAAA